MADNEYWPLAKEVLSALGQQYLPAMEKRADDAGMGDCDWYLLLPALIFDPEPISTSRLLVRVPYYAPQVYEHRLERLMELGYLKATGTGPSTGHEPALEYNLTESGRMTIQWLLQAADTSMQALHPLPLIDLERLAALLRSIVESSMAAPEPPAKWSLRLNRRTDHALIAPVIVRIDQYLSDLKAYREDCHNTAWQNDPATGSLDAAAWEIFSYIWRAESFHQTDNSLDRLTARLDRRGHPRQIYVRALKELDKLGWVQVAAGTYSVTPLGAKIRQAAEARTDRYFYAPWTDALTTEELAELKELLVRMWDGLKERMVVEVNHKA